ncbi:hypothetical protein E2C01_096714 [Portunus trituberculatus]|uniref:Uncharacterized protein n=1 Tax=Portunus trituberculatus TaxID=210409 RepID=A0A5B7K2R3_PORTR|nr:hypothetical protein [Portunus trituberculatus]
MPSSNEAHKCNDGRFQCILQRLERGSGAVVLVMVVVVEAAGGGWKSVGKAKGGKKVGWSGRPYIRLRRRTNALWRNTSRDPELT